MLMYLYIYTYINVCIYTSLYMRLYVYIYVYIHMCVFINAKLEVTSWIAYMIRLIDIYQIPFLLISFFYTVSILNYLS